MKILFAIGTSKQHRQGDFVIDRADLVRKVPAIHTWVEDVILAGHDVLFFEGGSETEYYEESTRTLHLTVDDRYEPDPNRDGSVCLSRLYIKNQHAYRWILQNKEFDKMFSCDDDVYVNFSEFMKMNLDVDFTGITGGAGFLFSRRAMEIIVNHTNTTHRVADHAMVNALHENAGNDFVWGKPEYGLNQAFYIPGELAPTVHYVTGKRMYHLHNVVKYFKENGVTNRKIILAGPLDSSKANPWDTVTYLTVNKHHTPRWYDFTTDPNGWEYHGGYQRSSTCFGPLVDDWPYAESATKFFVLTPDPLIGQWWVPPFGGEHYYECLKKLIEKCEYSLINKDNLILCYYRGADQLHKTEVKLDGWVLDNSVKTSLKLNFEALNECDFYVKQGVSYG